MKFVLLVLALIIGQLCLAEEAAAPPKAKEEVGAGRYSSSNRHHRNRDYKNDDYGHKKRHYHVPLIDDYVCDLDATILVVSSKHHVKEEKSYGNQGGYGNQGDYNQGGDYGNQGGYGNQQGGSYGAPQQDYNQGGGYGNQGGNYNQGGSYGNQQQNYNQGYGDSSYGGGQGYDNKPKRHEYATPEALRLKCSHIAVNSERDCRTCCQLSARRYHGTSRSEIFGFIVDATEIKYDDKGYVRSKRNAGEYGNQPTPPAQNYGSNPAPNYGSAPPAQNYGPAPPAPSYGSAPPAPSYDNNYTPAPQNYQPAPSYEAQTPGYQSEGSYPAASSDSYAPTNYEYKRRPANARCVCCAPKANHYHRRRQYDNYDRSESNEY